MIICNHLSSSKLPRLRSAFGLVVNFRRGGKCDAAAFSSPPQLYTLTFTEQSRGEPKIFWLLVRKRTFINFYILSK